MRGHVRSSIFEYCERDTEILRDRKMLSSEMLLHCERDAVGIASEMLLALRATCCWHCECTRSRATLENSHSRESSESPCAVGTALENSHSRESSESPCAVDTALENSHSRELSESPGELPLLPWRSHTLGVCVPGPFMLGFEIPRCEMPHERCLTHSCWVADAS
jgi:hypothetical protein